jgi:AraC-like DNA-binding protein
MSPSVQAFTFEDVDDYADHVSSFTVKPLQLTLGPLRLGFSTLRFEDVAVSCIDSNQKLVDHLCMDPSWLMVVIQLTPERWNSHEAPPSSLVVVAPGSDYRTMVFGGFRCVDFAVRVDLAEEIGLGPLCRLTGAKAILPLPPMTAKIAERWATELVCRPSTNALLGMSDHTAEALRERCVDFLRYLKETISASLTVKERREATARWIGRFDIVEAALRVIDATPIHEPLSVATLAQILGTTTRTLLNAFGDALETTPSRYLLARRLHGARRALRSGASPTVTDAALAQDFVHLGRFSQHYRTLFGELPSYTLQRSLSVRAGKTE